MPVSYIVLYDHHRAKVLRNVLNRLLQGEELTPTEIARHYNVSYDWVRGRMVPYLKKMGVITVIRE